MNYTPDFEKFNEDDFESEVEAERADILAWAARDAVIRAKWMDKEFFFTDDLSIPLERTRQSVNKLLIDAGEEPWIKGKNVWKGNNLWKIESLSKLSGDTVEGSTSSDGVTKKAAVKGQRKQSGATKAARSAKRSSSKKD